MSHIHLRRLAPRSRSITHRAGNQTDLAQLWQNRSGHAHRTGRTSAVPPPARADHLVFFIPSDGDAATCEGGDLGSLAAGPAGAPGLATGAWIPPGVGLTGQKSRCTRRRRTPQAATTQDQLFQVMKKCGMVRPTTEEVCHREAHQFVEHRWYAAVSAAVKSRPNDRRRRACCRVFECGGVAGLQQARDSCAKRMVVPVCGTVVEPQIGVARLPPPMRGAWPEPVSLRHGRLRQNNGRSPGRRVNCPLVRSRPIVADSYVISRRYSPRPFSSA